MVFDMAWKTCTNCGWLVDCKCECPKPWWMTKGKWWIVSTELVNDRGPGAEGECKMWKEEVDAAVVVDSERGQD